jgi:hypothetical protein
VFECFGACRRFCSKLLGCEHRTVLRDTVGGLPLNGAVMSTCWVLLAVYGDDQDQLRYLSERAGTFILRNRPLPPVVAAIHPQIEVSPALRRLPKPDEHSNDS